MRITTTITKPSKGDTRLRSGFIWICRLGDEYKIMESCTWREVFQEVHVTNRGEEEARLFQWVAIEWVDE
jgi:hypothetical protein